MTQLFFPPQAPFGPNPSPEAAADPNATGATIAMCAERFPREVLCNPSLWLLLLSEPEHVKRAAHLAWRVAIGREHDRLTRLGSQAACAAFAVWCAVQVASEKIMVQYGAPTTDHAARAAADNAYRMARNVVQAESEKKAGSAGVPAVFAAKNSFSLAAVIERGRLYGHAIDWPDAPLRPAPFVPLGAS